MEHDSIPGLEPQKVARLVGIALNGERGEGTNTDAAIRELLQACLADTPWVEQSRERAWPKAIGRLLAPHRPEAKRSVAEILLDPRSTLSAAKAIRRYAKEKAARTDDEAEHTVMTTIYFAAIANRLVFHGQRITTYSYESLRSSFGKLRGKSWMPAELGELFEKAEEVCRNKAQDGPRPKAAGQV